MERTALVAQLINEKHRATLAHMAYLSNPREYAPGKELYMREVHFLMAVSTEEATTASDLAAALDVTLGAVSQMAARLEGKGFITRTKDPRDKRQTLVTLTDTGKDLRERHRAYDDACFEEISTLFSQYSDEDIKALIAAEKLFQQALSTKSRAPF